MQELCAIKMPHKDKRIILVGGGGHCNACLEVLYWTRWEVVHIVRDSRTLEDKDWDVLVEKCPNFLIAVGQIKDSLPRYKIFTELSDREAKFPTIISPKANISHKAHIGNGNIIMHGVHINSGATVGSFNIINTQCNIEHDAYVGNFCHISTGAVVNGDCMVDDGVFIGSNAVILNQIRISRNIIIGAGSVVVEGLKEPGVYIGNPARFLKR